MQTLESVGFRDVEKADVRRNPRNDYTDWASFFATKPLD
jgi:hypothetical protein